MWLLLVAFACRYIGRLCAYVFARVCLRDCVSVQLLGVVCARVRACMSMCCLLACLVLACLCICVSGAVRAVVVCVRVGS